MICLLFLVLDDEDSHAAWPGRTGAARSEATPMPAMSQVILKQPSTCSTYKVSCADCMLAALLQKLLYVLYTLLLVDLHLASRRGQNSLEKKWLKTTPRYIYKASLKITTTLEQYFPRS